MPGPPAPSQLAWEVAESEPQGASARVAEPPWSRQAPGKRHLGPVASQRLRRLLSIQCPFLSSSSAPTGLRSGSPDVGCARQFLLAWCCRLSVARLSGSWAGRARGRLTSAGGIPLLPGGGLVCRCCSTTGPHICLFSSKDGGVWKPPTTDSVRIRLPEKVRRPRLNTLSGLTVPVEEELSRGSHDLGIDTRVAPGELGTEGSWPWRSVSA